ncbi:MULTISPECIES: protein-export chaperone SecB [Companilactobacillus]|uniref:Preprotein translocase subunit SecB n=1 Tax=Companilactobacillus heilongjiangensis TaxID=1074467 RepID=A0A0K2LE60_9LACO|nr:protein-export chaperone SecB [Companilactobacillus heilongjiangensis]ALB29586.1 hypothetical protein JP39_09605 [Companilactobacillus heilongjiangensis]
MNTEQNKSILEFTNPVLKRAIFQPNPKFDKKNSKNIKMNLKTSNSGIDTKLEYHSSDVVLTVTNISSDDSLSSNEDPFVLIVSMAARFRWPESTPKDVEESFVRTNAPSLLLSYIRPLVSNITGLSEFGIQNIPFIDFTNSIED